MTLVPPARTGERTELQLDQLSGRRLDRRVHARRRTQLHAGIVDMKVDGSLGQTNNLSDLRRRFAARGPSHMGAYPTMSGKPTSIEDRGIDIPESDRAQILTRCYRGSNVRGVVGTGIGLFLVATVVHLHGGSMTFESGKGKGSRFIVTLPNGRLPQATSCHSAMQT